MKDFEQIKKEFIPIAKSQSPCEPQFKRVLKATSFNELLIVVLENLPWCLDHNCFFEGFHEKVVTADFGGYLDLRGCDLKGITLPTSIGGSLDLRGCDLKGITLPKNVNVIK
jgi:hypothetical protein